jgi:hypothetical protein
MFVGYLKAKSGWVVPFACEPGLQQPWRVLPPWWFSWLSQGCRGTLGVVHSSPSALCSSLAFSFIICPHLQRVRRRNEENEGPLVLGNILCTDERYMCTRVFLLWAFGGRSEVGKTWGLRSRPGVFPLSSP